jgi:hypothetical protein
MSTTLQIDLSTAMQSWLSHGGSGNGVSAYAILYGSATPGGSASTPLAWKTLVDDGHVQSSGSVTLDLTTATQTTLYGGKVYFLIQSIDDQADAIDPSTLAQSAITWSNAHSLDYRYDSIEVSLTGAAGDAANLTSIEGFGIAMTLEAETGSRGYATTAAELFGLLADAPPDPVAGKPAVTTFTQGGLKDDKRQAVSPAVAVVSDNEYPLYAPRDWDAYIDGLKAPATRIVVNGYFNGAGDVQADASAGTPVIWRNAGFFSYALEWDERGETFWLTPTAGSQIQGAIRMTAETLSQSIYSTLGTVRLFDTKGGAEPFELYPGSSEMNVGANNAWGQALQQLTLGLTAGYLQSTGASPNTAVTAPIDLNKNYNWDPSYAFGTNTETFLDPDTTQLWDPYSAVFFSRSNSYATQYGDALMNDFAQGGPQLPTYSGSANVSTLTVTLYADNETPPPGDYTPPVIYDHVAGSGAGGKYEVAVWHAGNPANITLSFNPGDSLAQSLVLRDDVAISIRILTGYDGDTPKWQELAIGGDKKTPWQTWTFGYADGTYSLTGNGGAGQASQSLVLTGVPMADSGVGWYQIVVAAPGFEKVYNLYTTTFTPAPTTGDPDPIPQFSNFGADPSLFGIDGLATLTAGPVDGSGGLQTFSVAVTGVSPTLDLSLMQANTSETFLAKQTIATAPVAGMLKGGKFTALAGQTADVHDTAGKGVDLRVTSHTGLLAFGWTGLNDAPDTSTWTETFTNLVQGKSIADVLVTQQGGGSHIAPLHAKADIAGGWQTPTAQQLGKGTYHVTMSAYAAKADAPGTPNPDERLTNDSAVLIVTVALSDLALAADPAEGSLSLVADGSDTSGNWIRVSAAPGGLPRGASMALYATDSEGQPIGADGQPVSAIEDAILGWVGAVGSDDGAALYGGSQMVYLGLGQELRFAFQTESGTLRPTSPDIEDPGDGTFTLQAEGITLQAEVDNTLSPVEQMASPQRISGLPLVWLTQGETVTLELAGSAGNRNTLGFVRLDLDQASGALSLDGVAAEDAEGFRQAVRDALDSGFRATLGGGDFAETASWTVAGDDGYYAPVLITQSGDIFVPGTGNAGGQEYLRIFGANTFGFEDLTAAEGSDFDYNDLVMRLVPALDGLV